MMTLVHRLEYGMHSGAMMAADIAELLPEFRHVLVADVGVEHSNPDLDLILAGGGLEVVYPGRTGRLGMYVHAVLTYRPNCWFTVRGRSAGSDIRMVNAPICSKHDKLKNSMRGNLKLHIGMLQGRSHRDLRFMEAVVAFQPESSTLFFTPHGGCPTVLEKPVEKGDAFACRYGPGLMSKYLEWIDILIMPENNISDRLRLEAQASGIPVLTGTPDKLLDTINRVRGNREQLNDLRRAALHSAAEHDMTFQIVKLKKAIREAMSWNITFAQSEKALQDMSIPAAAHI